MVFTLKKKYSWSYGGFNVDANTVGKTIEKIEAETGSVTKEKLLDASRDENSPTHALFEWNDEIAGEKYRLIQASQAIAHLKIEVVESETDDTPINVSVKAKKPETEISKATPPETHSVKTVRAFMSADYFRGSPRSANYISTETALSNEDHRQAIIRNALTEFENTKEKYSFLSELAALYEAIDREAGRYGV